MPTPLSDDEIKHATRANAESLNQPFIDLCNAALAGDHLAIERYRARVEELKKVRDEIVPPTMR